MKKENECLSLCFGCSLFLLLLAFCAASVAYIVFGIIFLIDDYKIASECHNSSLWGYVLTSIIIAFLRAGAHKSKDNEGNLCVLICLGIVELCFGIWGGVELFEKSCDDLTKTRLWTFAAVTFSLQIFVASLLLVIIPITLCILGNKKENNDDEFADVNSSMNDIKNKISTKSYNVADEV